VRIAVTGSIATDHLMTFNGRFADALLADQLAHLSVSFLVDDLEVRRGGTGANIAFAMGLLGASPLLVGAVGADFAEYASWLTGHGVDVSGVRISDRRHTARFVCTTDVDQNQIASFYPGAMAEAREIELAALCSPELGPLDLVVVSPNDPAAMQRHTTEARERGIPFAADPSQQLSSLDGDAIRALITGAEVLLSNAYEAAVIERKTGWSSSEVLAQVGVRVTTHGAEGVVIETADGDALKVPVVPARTVADPTGVGVAFRGGYLTGRARGLGFEPAAQLGCLMATLCVETVGTQEYAVDPDDALARLTAAYGPEASAQLAEAIAQ
jgi:adenosine kinase